MFKKGELTTQQIVVLIILVASFAVILFFIFRLNLGRETANEICHNSVIMRGKSVLPTDVIPLKCKRQYVCLSEDGSCESLTKPDIIKVKTKKEVYGALADQLAECWWMFGEGKINYAGKDTLPKIYCPICSQIAFDNSVKKEIFNGKGDFGKKKLYEYMEKTKRSDGKTYSSYLGIGKFSKFKGNFGSIDLDKYYYSLTGITSDVNTLGWIIGVGTGAALVAGGLILSPVTGGLSLGSVIGILSVAGSATAGGIAGGTIIAPLIKGLNNKQLIPSSLIKVNSPEFKALNCSEILTSS